MTLQDNFFFQDFPGLSRTAETLVTGFWHTEPPLPTPECMGGGASPEEGDRVFFLGYRPFSRRYYAVAQPVGPNMSADPPPPLSV